MFKALLIIALFSVQSQALADGKSSSCLRSAKAFISKKLKINKKLEAAKKDNQKWFGDLHKELADSKVTDHSSHQNFKKAFEEFILLKELLDPETMSKAGLPDVDYAHFHMWLKNSDTFRNSRKQPANKKLSFEDFYQFLLKKYEAEAPKKPTPLISIFQRERRRAARTALEAAQDLALVNYDKLMKRKMSAYSHSAKSVLEKDIALAVAQFRLIEPEFRHLDFMRWLKKTNALEAEHPYKTLGELLKAKYVEYAPFAKMDDRTLKEKLLNLLGRKGDLATMCRKSDECYGRILTQRLKNLFNSKGYKGKFACVAKHPTVMVTQMVDMLITWSMMSLMYKNNRDSFQRFPWEVMANGLLINPFMAEANCRTTFRGRYSFGEPLKELTHRKFKHKVKFAAKNLGTLSKIAGVGIVSFVGFTYAFDQLYGAIGHPIEKPMNLMDQIKTIPFLFLYSGVYNRIKYLTVFNPLRYKMIPTLTSLLQKKLGIHGLSFFATTGINAVTYMGIEYYQTWEFLKHYRQRIMPMLMGLAGIELSTAEKAGAATDKVRTDPKSDIKVKKSFSISGEDPSVRTYYHRYSNGVETSVDIRHSYKDNKEFVEIVDTNIHIPEELLDSELDKVIAPK